MKTLEIRIKSREQTDAEFIEAYKGAHSGKKAAPQRGVSFTSLEAVRALLTEKRLSLLHLIQSSSPRSINQLAKLAGRDFKNVHADVMLLKHYGLLRLEAKDAAGQAISVPYQAINIHALI